MALADPVLPYGLRDVRLTPINSDGSLGTPVDLPVAQTLSFSEAEEFEELRGDDRVVTVHGKGPTVDFDIEAGGISLEAWHVMTGGVLEETGATPNQTKSLLKKVTESRPYFRIEGQIINDVDGDTHVVIYKAKVTDTLEGEFADGQFFITSCSGQGIGDGNEDLYKITWNETSAAIGTGGINELQLVAGNGSAGTFILTYAGQPTSALAWNISAANMELALVALSNIAPGDVEVSGTTNQWYVEFTGTLGETNVAEMTIDVTSLTGDLIVTTIRQGAAAP